MVSSVITASLYGKTRQRKGGKSWRGRPRLRVRAASRRTNQPQLGVLAARRCKNPQRGRLRYAGGLSYRCLHADNFSRFAFRRDLKWPAANFAIGRESLPGEAGVNDHLKRLAAERALDVGEFFHAGM